MRKSRLLLLVTVLFLFTTLISIPARTVSADSDTNSTQGLVPGGIYGISARALAARMAANPRPNLSPIPVDEKVLYHRAYRRVLKETDIFDAPNGNIVGHLDAGFNFVNAGRGVDGWVQIRPHQFVPETALGPINTAVSKFSGVAMPDGLPMQAFGWVLQNTKPSSSPGLKASDKTPEIKRYTLVNIFAVENLQGWEWYLIGPNQWIVQTRVARLQPVARPQGVSGKWFAIDLYEQTLTAYEDDKAVFATLISSGLDKWATSEGVFQIKDRYEVVRMSGASGQPDFYYLPEVPYVMYFNDAEQALHGAYWHDGFGYRHSHGCVNLSMMDSKWAFDWTNDAPQAYVYVYHSGEYKHGAPR